MKGLVLALKTTAVVLMVIYIAFSVAEINNYSVWETFALVVTTAVNSALITAIIFSSYELASILILIQEVKDVVVFCGFPLWTRHGFPWFLGFSEELARIVFALGDNSTVQETFSRALILNQIIMFWMALVWWVLDTLSKQQTERDSVALPIWTATRRYEGLTPDGDAK